MSLTIVPVPDFREEADGACEALRGAGVRVARSGEPAAGTAEAIAAVLAGAASLALVRADAIGEDESDRVTVAAVLPRNEPRDVLIAADPGCPTLASLPAGARVGTAGVRRVAFLRSHRPDLVAVRGWNGGGPAEALESGAFDAVVLGATDARRWGVAHRATEALDAKAWVPSAGQGTPLLVCAPDDAAAVECGALIDQPAARAGYEAERAVRGALSPGTDGPLGALALPYGRWIRVWGMVASLDGAAVVRGDVTGSLEDPAAAGRALADLLLARGAASLLGEAAGR